MTISILTLVALSYFPNEHQVMMDAAHVLAHYPRLGGADVIVHHCKKNSCHRSHVVKFARH